MSELNQRYTLYYHNPTSTDWSPLSYKRIYQIDDAEEYWYIIQNGVKELITTAMFFLMREDIFPLWDSPDNIRGSSISMKVTVADTYKLWNIIVAKLLTGTLSTNNELVNGISVSPKKNFCIIKIWLNYNPHIKVQSDAFQMVNLPNIREYNGLYIFSFNRDK
jgi:hypothetical protein